MKKDIRVNGKRLETHSLKSRLGQGYLLSTTFNILLESMDSTI
jgi:hypothetical protein